MALEAVSKIIDQVNQVYARGKLEKACLVRFKSRQGNIFGDPERYPVQFNPSEYSIRRGYQLSEKRPIGEDLKPIDLQTGSAEYSVLTVKLYFDSYTELVSEQGFVNYVAGHVKNSLGSDLSKSRAGPAVRKVMPGFDMDEDVSPIPDSKVNKRLTEILKLIKYNNEDHEPPYIGFVWGESIAFFGKLVHYDADYTVFDRDGTPVRAILALTIMGEDNAFESDSKPFESPDRTKQRTLRHGDQLWMMAHEEYGSVAHWKTIARANNLLNPRMLKNVVRLKVPSIR
ncbi:MAG: hypothetical protein LBU86_00960 [Oscillospiraceae bacterium]|jgi:hypothetical protein|nr:hypothetical protein [Oscillospiraceae bacterium]